MKSMKIDKYDESLHKFFGGIYHSCVLGIAKSDRLDLTLALMLVHQSHSLTGFILYWLFIVWKLE